MAVLVQWAQAVRAAGVERIAGDRLVDDSFVDRQWTAPGWPEDQRFFWYGAPAGALSFNDNCVYMTARGGAGAGDAPTLDLKPDVEGLDAVVRCRTASTTRLTCIREGDFTFVALGSVAPRRAVGQYVTVGDPGVYTVLAFARALAGQGVTIAGKVRRQTPQDSARQRRVLVTGQSSLRESVAVANKRSQNFYAEQIFKTLGAVQANEGSFAGGARAISRYLGSIGMDSGDVVLVDGSGLSKENRATPEAVVRFLAAINASPCGEVFRNSLAVSGDEAGTLRHRLTEPGLRGRVFAKTGTLSGASALSGYVLSSGGRYAFSVLCAYPNGSGADRARRLQDEICRALAGRP